MHNAAMTSRHRLSEARRRKDLTQGELAKLIGTTQGTLSRIERGTATPDAAQAQRLIAILQVTLDDCVRVDIDESAANDSTKATG